MSAAIYAKNARARAAIAAAYIRRGSTDGRGFSDCFEMNDGDEVVRHLLTRAETDLRIRAFAIRARWIVRTPGEIAACGLGLYQVDPSLPVG